MDFSSLVLMERDKDTNHLIREIGSYEVSDGAEYITRMYYDGEKVRVFFDTKKDVEEWEFSAIYDLFDAESFEAKGYDIEEADDEYNPTWKVSMDFNEEHRDMQDELNGLCALIDEKIHKVLEDIQGKENEYQ